MNSKSYYRYEDLKAISTRVRSKLFAEGKFRAERRIRRKPRDPADLKMLYRKAVNTLRKYPPRKEGEFLILPYFFDTSRFEATSRNQAEKDADSHFVRDR